MWALLLGDLCSISSLYRRSELEQFAVLSESSFVEDFIQCFSQQISKQLFSEYSQFEKKREKMFCCEMRLMFET